MLPARHDDDDDDDIVPDALFTFLCEHVHEFALNFVF